MQPKKESPWCGLFLSFHLYLLSVLLEGSESFILWWCIFSFLLFLLSIFLTGLVPIPLHFFRTGPALFLPVRFRLVRISDFFVASSLRRFRFTGGILFLFRRRFRHCLRISNVLFKVLFFPFISD